MSTSIFGSKTSLGSVAIIIACLVLGGFIALQTMCACRKEGYDSLTSSKELIGATRDYSMGEGVKGSWEKSLRKAAVGGGFPSFEQKNNTQHAAKPCAASEMVYFANTKFAPECCPAIYSNDSGCVCATKEQYNYLNQRGGNRTLGGDF